MTDSCNRSVAKGNEVRGVVKRVVDMLIRERSSRIEFRKIAKDLEIFSEKGTAILLDLY